MNIFQCPLLWYDRGHMYNTIGLRTIPTTKICPFIDPFFTARIKVHMHPYPANSFWDRMLYLRTLCFILTYKRDEAHFSENSRLQRSSAIYFWKKIWKNLVCWRNLTSAIDWKLLKNNFWRNISGIFFWHFALNRRNAWNQVVLFSRKRKRRTA